MLNVSFIFAGYENGRPYWESTQYGMKIIWTGLYWQIINWPYDGTPVNYTDTDIPLTGWQLINNTSMTATFNVNLGECCFKYSINNNVSESISDVKYIDCNYNQQFIEVPYGFTGSFCATSIIMSNPINTYVLTSDACSPNTTCYNWELTGPVTVYYTDCNGTSGNVITVNNGNFDSICARSIDVWDNESGFYQQGFC